MAEFESISTAEASNADDVMTKMLQDMQGSIHFVSKKLRPSHVPEDSISKNCTLDTVQASSFEMSHSSQNSQEPPTGDESEQNAGSRIVHVKMELEHSKISLPSFIQRLVEYIDQDSAGNTCGARFEVSFTFLEIHGIQLQPLVKLQGIHEDSPIRTITCSQIMQKADGERSTRPASLWLGWGDFVRENAVRAGQELVFALTSESFFVVREVSEIVI